MSHAETTRRGLSGAVLAHLAELRLEPREIRRLRVGCLGGPGGEGSLSHWHDARIRRAAGRPTDKRALRGILVARLGATRPARMPRRRCTTQLESKVLEGMIRPRRYALGVTGTRHAWSADGHPDGRRLGTVSAMES